jgi:hypothetical protein
MTLENISERYDYHKFDQNYNSIISIELINKYAGNIPKSFNLRLKTLNNLIKNSNPKKINILCTHGENIFYIFFMYQIIKKQKKDYTLEELNKNFAQYFKPHYYCYWILFENNKIKKFHNNNGYYNSIMP